MARDSVGDTDAGSCFFHLAGVRLVTFPSHFMKPRIHVEMM